MDNCEQIQCTYLPLSPLEKREEVINLWPWPNCPHCQKPHLPWYRRITLLLDPTRDETFKPISEKSPTSERGNKISPEIATIFQNLRLRLGMDKVKFAKAAHIPSSYIYSLELYGYRPSMEILRGMCANLGIPLEYLEVYWHQAKGKREKECIYTERDF